MGERYLYPRFEVLCDENRCTHCKLCQQQCTHGVHQFDSKNSLHRIDESLCVNCQRCAAFCPTQALKIMPARCRFRDNAIWTDETLRRIHIQADTGGILLGSCGNPGKQKDYWDDLTIQAAQVTAAPIDPLREPPETGTALGSSISQFKLKTPIVFAAMSFGSLSLRSQECLARAASELGILWNSGEGGLHPKLLEYSKTAIVQVASGRFGVTKDILNRAAAIEIKLGQGGKPGVGGHLPGEKVTEAVAALRGIPVGTDAISPALHHDIHSPEDLRQLIRALRAVTDGRKPIIVKVAAVHNIAEIACVVARSGADILCIDGCHGGTGAAPVEIRDNVGIPLALALATADTKLRQDGLRENISILAGGSIRSSADMVKVLALGADACCIGTAALVALGCRLCRACQSSRCAWGIATQDPILEARLDVAAGSRRLVNLVKAWDHGLKEMLGGMGFGNVAALTGNRDVLRGIGLQKEELEILGVKHAGQ